MQSSDDEAPLMDVQEAARHFRAKEAIILDVRERSELTRAKIDGALHIPMREVAGRLGELPKDKPILVLCHHGGRSQAVADFLLPHGFKATNIAGGINAWADVVDASVGKY